MSRMRRSAIVAALACLVLTGCSGSGEPEVGSTFTPSPTVSSSSAAPTAEPTEPSLGGGDGAGLGRGQEPSDANGLHP